MKYKVITSLVGLFFFFMAHCQRDGIKARYIAQKFLSTYDIHELSFPRIEFEKRKANWYVKTIDFVGSQPVRSAPILFYEGSKNAFVPLKFEKNKSAVAEDIDETMPEYDSYNFDLQPYYGYPGWYKDVINEYEHRSDLTDDQLHALARAYNSLATEPITGQGGYAVPEDAYKLYFKRNAFSDEQLRRFNISADSAIEKYRQLAVRNPGFQTRVGNISEKYAMEVMSRFHILLVFSEKGLKEMTLPKNLFKDSTLDMARGFLEACPKQAVFVAMGDNDFYPLLYLQQAEGLRRDVYVINYNLMAVDKYIYRITLPQFDAKPILIRADTTMYAGSKNEVIYIHDDPKMYYTASGLTMFLEHEKGDSLGRKILSLRAISIPVKRAGKYDTGVYISMQDNSYLYKNHWVMFDIINDLDGRSLCLAYLFNDELRDLNQHLKPVKGGLIYQLND